MKIINGTHITPQLLEKEIKKNNLELSEEYFQLIIKLGWYDHSEPSFIKWICTLSKHELIELYTFLIY